MSSEVMVAVFGAIASRRARVAPSATRVVTTSPSTEAVREGTASVEQRDTVTTVAVFDLFLEDILDLLAGFFEVTLGLLEVTLDLFELSL